MFIKNHPYKNCVLSFQICIGELVGYLLNVGAIAFYEASFLASSLGHRHLLHSPPHSYL